MRRSLATLGLIITASLSISAAQAETENEARAMLKTQRITKSTARGIKKVEPKFKSVGNPDYSIPVGDLFLDRSGVGEHAPADDQIK